ncbi:MAG: HesA/MoeB/ThiF family protein [bacterium]
MTQDIYDRQQEIGLSIPGSVTMVGVGGIGANAAILAAESGVRELYLFDPDVLEVTNLNRMPFCQSRVNSYKVHAVQDYIQSIRPDCNVIAIPERLDDTFLRIQLSISSAIMDFTDSPKTQFKLYNACRDAGKRYIRAGYDGTHITVTSVVSGWIRTDVEEEHYAVNPSWAVPAVIVAALAIAKLEKYPDQEVSLDISEIGIPIIQKQKKLTKRCVVERYRGGRTRN